MAASANQYFCGAKGSMVANGYGKPNAWSLLCVEIGPPSNEDKYEDDATPERRTQDVEDPVPLPEFDPPLAVTRSLKQPDLSQEHAAEEFKAGPLAAAQAVYHQCKIDKLS
ncbi:uncharacterized protein PgNI_00282 [Pyricularia grisea]|uniref:Uncharacterized protein n=1 Tax=Pyricularia grisea TaxID=148305 RepID=A0A6P8BFU1_PYRGI|nr:uncharacterized protein PgNI_00282 [Pyricularia grisea]TLD15711.1 hypothetical protein PgNI_00282 [Pyricularia grisea]